MGKEKNDDYSAMDNVSSKKHFFKRVIFLLKSNLFWVIISTIITAVGLYYTIFNNKETSTKIENNKNINTGVISTAGDVVLGDNLQFNFVTNQNINNEYKEINSKEYVQMLDHLETLNQLLEVEKDESKKEIIRKDITKKNSEIESYKKSIIQLAESFTKIDNYSDRLNKAKNYFDSGDLDKARDILDEKLLKEDQQALLIKKEIFENSEKLKNNANEYLIKAQLTSLDLSINNRFEKAKEYYNESIKSFPNKNNTIEYAMFLMTYGDYSESKKQLKESYKYIEEDDFLRLNDYYGCMGLIHAITNTNTEDDAENNFLKSIEYSRKLVEQDNKYTSRLANSLYSYTVFLIQERNFQKAESIIDEASKIYYDLYEETGKHLFDVYRSYIIYATVAVQFNNLDKAKEIIDDALRLSKYLTINDMPRKDSLELINAPTNALSVLAIIYIALNQFDKAESVYLELIEKMEYIVGKDSERYIKEFPTYLSSLAGVYAEKNNYLKSLKYYNQAINILKELNLKEPHAYYPKLATTISSCATMLNYFDNWNQAEPLVKESLEMFRLLSTFDNYYIFNLVFDLNLMANIYVNTNRPIDALKFINEALIVAHENKSFVSQTLSDYTYELLSNVVPDPSKHISKLSISR